MHVNVDVCGVVPKMRLVDDRLQVRPAGVEAETASVAVPLPVALTVIVEVPEPPGNIWLGDTALAVTAVMVNACTTPLTWTFTVRVSVPPIPVIVTTKFCAGEHPPAVSVAVLGVGSVTEAGEIVALHPAGVVEVIDRLMPPVKPLSAFAVIVDVAVPGDVYEIGFGLADRWKSTTWKRIAAVV